MNIQESLSTMVIEAAKEKGFNGVMALGVAVKKKTGLSQPRVSKAWRGNTDAKIGDYATIMKFLDSNLVVKLKKEIKK